MSACSRKRRPHCMNIFSTVMTDAPYKPHLWGWVILKRVLDKTRAEAIVAREQVRVHSLLVDFPAELWYFFQSSRKYLHSMVSSYAMGRKDFPSVLMRFPSYALNAR